MKKSLAPAFLLGIAIIVSGCTTSQVLNVPSSSTETAHTTRPINNNIKVRFDPIIGAPTNASTQLEAELPTLAAQHGLRLATRGDTSATHVVQGYFSAITENGETTVIYVWDIFNASGTRLHRIQGQSKSPVQNGEGWASVGQETMQAVATQTVNQLTAWLAAAAR